MKYVFGICLALLLALPLQAQENAPDTLTGAPEQQYRDPKKALILGSVIPGAGYIYAGEYLKGFLAYGSTVSIMGMGVMAYALGDCGLDRSGSCRSGRWQGMLLGSLGAGTGIWIWVSSARDARRAAERANERHRRRFESVSPLIRPFSGPQQTTQIGVTARW